MGTHANAAGDIITAKGATAAWAEARGYERIAGDDDKPLANMTGAEIDVLLEAADLPRTGTVPERRARLQEYLEDEVVVPTPDPDQV